MDTPKTKNAAVGLLKPDLLTTAAFVVMVVQSGSNAVAIQFSNLELPPFWGAAFRFLLAGLVFWVIVRIRRIPIPRGRALQGAAIYGALSIGVYYAFIYWALQSETASLTMVVLALVPLLTFFLAWAHRLETFNLRSLAGALVAFSGILIAIADQIGFSFAFLPLLAILAGGAALAEGSVIYKAYPKGNLLAVNAISHTIGAVLLLLISLAAGETWSFPRTGSAAIALAYLALIGSTLFCYLYLYVLERWTASATSFSFLLIPVATIFIAGWIGNEVVMPRFLLGSTIVLLGVYVGALAPKKSVRLFNHGARHRD